MKRSLEVEWLSVEVDYALMMVKMSVEWLAEPESKEGLLVRAVDALERVRHILKEGCLDEEEPSGS